MSAAPGKPIPAACGDWAAAKAAYRFFDNPRVTIAFSPAISRRLRRVLRRAKVRSCRTRPNLSTAARSRVNRIHQNHRRRALQGRAAQRADLVRGADAFEPGRHPHRHTPRSDGGEVLDTKFKGTLALKRHINPTRVPIETKESYRWLENLRQSIALVGAPERCVHVGDRESDIYELYCTAQDLGTSFLVRVQTNRLAERPADAASHDPAHRVFAQLAAAPWAGRHRITVDQDETTWLQVKFAAINTLPPVGKQKRYGPQVLTYIHALEEDPPPGREPIDWKLVTNLPVEDLSVAVEKLGWYALR